MSSRKGLIRSKSRRGAASGKLGAPAEKRQERREPAACERCGAVWSRRTWRQDRGVTLARAARLRWTVCPACTQRAGREYFGRVLLRGGYVHAHEADIRRRIQNVAARAAHTQPERRLVSIEADTGGLEVLSTSQKLAHRIVRELKKTFGGRVSYQWSDTDGSLFARWERA
jgi:NMD protein affecting ribosome stability and mRNA decay